MSKVHAKISADGLVTVVFKKDLSDPADGVLPIVSQSEKYTLAGKANELIELAVKSIEKPGPLAQEYLEQSKAS